MPSSRIPAKVNAQAKSTTKKSTARKPKPKNGKSRIWLWSFLVIFLLSALVYHYRYAILFYFSFYYKNAPQSVTEAVEGERLHSILKQHPNKVLGIDVSQYQGNINWDEVRFVVDSVPVGFVFVRATAGADFVDKQFLNNWRQISEKGIAKGAYHFYRPNEPSTAQAELFIKTVKLQKGDLPPVLDIEHLPKIQSMERLKKGLKNWLEIVEKHYGVRPILYTGQHYFDTHLAADFPEYTYWIANYNSWVKAPQQHWTFWQFTEKGTVPGVDGSVDINLYNGTPKMLAYLRIRK